MVVFVFGGARLLASALGCRAGGNDVLFREQLDYVVFDRIVRSGDYNPAVAFQIS